MSGAAWYSFGALILYTAFNLLYKQYLGSLSPWATIPFYTAIVVVVSTGAFLHSKGANDFVIPSGAQWLALIVCGLVLVMADFCFTGAYAKGASLALNSTIVSLLPVTTAFVNLIITGKLPTIQQFSAFVLAIGAVVLIVHE